MRPPVDPEFFDPPFYQERIQAGKRLIKLFNDALEGGVWDPALILVLDRATGMIYTGEMDGPGGDILGSVSDHLGIDREELL